MTQFSTRRFSFSEASGFAAEASTLGYRAGVTPPPSIELRNPRTGGTCRFPGRIPIFHGTGSDRELAGWKYWGRVGDSRISLTIFND